MTAANTLCTHSTALCAVIHELLDVVLTLCRVAEAQSISLFLVHADWSLVVWNVLSL